MVRIASSFAVLSSVIAVAFASSAVVPAPLAADIEVIGKSTMAYDAVVSNFGATTGGNNVENIVSASGALSVSYDKATLDLTKPVLALSEADSKIVVAKVEAIEPILRHALETIVAKKSLILAAGNATVSAVVDSSLKVLHESGHRFEDALTAAVSAGLKVNVTVIAKANDELFAKAIASYAV